MNMNKHLLSLRIRLFVFSYRNSNASSQYLDMPPQRVLITWACDKVRCSKLADVDLAFHIHDMLKDYPGISYSRIASIAYKASRKQLATKVIP